MHVVGVLTPVAKPEGPKMILCNNTIIASSIELQTAANQKLVGNNQKLASHLSNLQLRAAIWWWVEPRIYRDGPPMHTGDRHHPSPLPFASTVQDQDCMPSLPPCHPRGRAAVFFGVPDVR
jgi:hypothetical protein